jgi:hypothetical protein
MVHENRNFELYEYEEVSRNYLNNNITQFSYLKAHNSFIQTTRKNFRQTSFILLDAM